MMKPKAMLAAAALAVAPWAAWATDDAAKIMEKAHLAVYYAGDDGKAHVHMEIVNPDGGKRIREFTILRK
ncbi:MAG: outer membrane lipoprotein-sorting protein, partial [Zetaproteobacteria bacterium]